ncbi:MAG: S41 family peptidase [Nannocystales bacterium]
MSPPRFTPLISWLLLAQLVLAGCVTAPHAKDVPSDPLRAFAAFLDATHPALHRFVGASELEARVDLEVKNLGGDDDPLALARAASRVAAAVGDAHLAVGLPPEVAEGSLVPFLLKRAGEHVFLDASEPMLPRGTEVLQVEGRPVGALFEAMAAMACVDGDRPEVRAAEVEHRFAFLALLELGAHEHYTLVVREPGGDPRTIQLEATDRAGVGRLSAQRYSAAVWGSPLPQGEPPWPTLTRISPTTQLLRLASFGYEDDAPYEERVEALFATLAPHERLVVDLRGNEGGNRLLGVTVLRRLLARPFAQWASVSTRVRAIPPGFEDLIEFPIVPEASLTGFPGKKAEGRWLVEGDPLAERMVPAAQYHPGEVVLFVDAATNSASIEFIAALLAHRDGVQVIGTQTQGACDRHNGQLPVVFQSQSLMVLVSLFDIELVPIPGCRPGHGVMPDVEVVYSETDFLGSRDPYLDAL